MLRNVIERMQQGHRTVAYPAGQPTLPDRFRGRPVIDAAKCPSGCRECVDACPTDAIAPANGQLQIDLGRCLFCTDCVDACPPGAVTYSPDFRLSTRRREDLVVTGADPLRL